MTAEVAHVGSGQVPQLAIKGQVSSSLPDALRLLQEAPIGTGETFAGWQGQGELDGALDLQIPLGKGTPRVVVDLPAAMRRYRSRTQRWRSSGSAADFATTPRVG